MFECVLGLSSKFIDRFPRHQFTEETEGAKVRSHFWHSDASPCCSQAWVLSFFVLSLSHALLKQSETVRVTQAELAIHAISDVHG